MVRRKASRAGSALADRDPREIDQAGRLIGSTATAKNSAGQLPLDRSNSLADLAARINAEHEAANAVLQQGLQHAVAAGRLLIEAKAQVKVHRGHWLPWLKANCTASPRTCQAYMQVAKSFTAVGGDDETNAQRVAHLSFRDALSRMAETGSIIADNSESWRRAIKQTKSERIRASYTLETPQALLPPPTGRRKLRVARNPSERQWILAIGPDVSRAALMQREQAAREAASVQQLQQQHDELLDQVAALEAEAKSLRSEADSVRSEITDEVRKLIGPVIPFTETSTFKCDEMTDKELAALSQEQLIERLRAATFEPDGPIEVIDRGFWGDTKLMGLATPQTTLGPGCGSGWTKIGSPEWLNELFPNLNEPDEEGSRGTSG